MKEKSGVKGAAVFSALKISAIMAPYQGPVTYPGGSSGPVAYTGQQVAEDEGMGCYQAP